MTIIIKRKIAVDNLAKKLNVTSQAVIKAALELGYQATISTVLPTKMANDVIDILSSRN